jgi:CheY-like chemotaxis protein
MAEKFSALRVLVVEDEPLIRWSIGETLTHALALRVYQVLGKPFEMQALEVLQVVARKQRRTGASW